MKLAGGGQIDYEAGPIATSTQKPTEAIVEVTRTVDEVATQGAGLQLGNIWLWVILVFVMVGIYLVIVGVRGKK